MGLCALCSPLRHYRRFAFALPLRVAHASTFLPPVPRRCFAFSAFRGSSPLRYHEGSDSCAAHLRRRSPHLLRHTFLSFRLQPRGLPSHRLPPRQRDPRVSDFAMNEKARRSSPPNRVRHPTDRLFASGCSPRRFGPTQLPSASELWLSPTRTFTVLMQRPHGRTHSGARGNPDPTSTWIPFFNGMTDTVRHLPHPPGFHRHDEVKIADLFCEPPDQEFSNQI